MTDNGYFFDFFVFAFFCEVLVADVVASVVVEDVPVLGVCAVDVDDVEAAVAGPGADLQSSDESSALLSAADLESDVVVVDG
jgi:hypothetical protein